MNLSPAKVNLFQPCALLAAAGAALLLSSCVTPPPPPPAFAPAPPRYGHQGTQSPSYPDPRAVTGPGEKPPTIVRDPANTNVDITPPPPRDVPPTTPAPLPPVTGNPSTPTPPATDTPAPPQPKPREDLPYGIPVVGKKGMVYSPYAPEKGQVDVDGYKRGTKVECPYTGKHFRVP